MAATFALALTMQVALASEPDCGKRTGAHLPASPQRLLGTELRLTDGRLTRLRPAKAYVLYYGAQWCGPCRIQVRAMKALYDAGDARRLGYEIVFVSADRSADLARAYAKAERMPWPHLPPGAKGPAGALTEPAQGSLPDMIVVDAQGAVLCRAYDADGRYLGAAQTFQALRRTLGAGD